MIYQRANLRPEEIATLELRALYEENGYRKYRMSRFEEYSLYANNRDFIAGDKVLTFTDLDGRLMALKPDVTMSIIKNTENTTADPEKLYYVENVYRESRESNSFREIGQIGLEMIGTVTTEEISQVLGMAVKTLATVSKDFVLEISHMGFTEGLLQTFELSQPEYNHLLRLISDKNVDGVAKVAAEAGIPAPMVEALCHITGLEGEAAAVIARAEKLTISNTMTKALEQLKSLCQNLKAAGLGENLRLDMSMVNDIDYYNGVIFKGYLRNSSKRILAGGQYDRAMEKLGRKAGAIGFALYLDEIARVEEDEQSQQDMLTVALPKGRLGDQVYEILSAAGFQCDAYKSKDRKLVVENPEKKIRYILVKPSDVAVYVEHKAADIGIVGKDILMETNPDVYELKDLNIGKCRMCVAAAKGYEDDPDRVLRVATKYVNTAKRHYQEQNRDISIIKLNGSIELGPVLGLSDVIVDIVETGSTIRANNLEVIEEFKDISARLIANKSSYKFKYQHINNILSTIDSPAKGDAVE